MNLFIDIDGVILGRDEPSSPKISLAPHFREFLIFALSHFDCFWLSTNCKGNAQAVLDYLRPFVPDDLMPLLSRVRPTSFETLKTEALVGDFYWVDDSPLAVEIAWLKKRGLLDRWIAVDTRKRPDDLLRAMERLRAVLRNK